MTGLRKSCYLLRWLCYAVLTPLFLAGCATGSHYQRPATDHGEWSSAGRLSTELILTSDIAEPDMTLWWRQFGDPQLDRLMAEAAADNKELAVAMANIDRARALRSEQASGYYPQLNAAAAAGRTRYSSQSSFGSTIGTRNSFNAGLDASWEADLFGRIRYAVEASDARIGAEIAAHDGLRLSILAETATAYFELRSLQAQESNIHRSIRLLREVEQIARAQLDEGVISRSDLLQARGERQSFESQLPNIQAEETVRIHRLSVLTGKSPETQLEELKHRAPLPEVKDRVPLGIRSRVLERRPDIRQAERQLAAATADLGSAEAARFPDFSLTGAIGTTARLFGDLFTAGTITSSVAAALNWPVFDGGRLEAQVKAADASRKAAMAGYQQSVLLALEDSENALLHYGQEWKTLSKLRQLRESRQKAFAIANARYDAGEVSFLSLIDAERNLNGARLELIRSHERLLSRLTALYKALGGEWNIK